MLAALGDKLLRVLPPAFAVLCVVNIAFMAGLTWVVSHNMDARNAMMGRIIEQCLKGGQ